ncbi:WD40-repeat-containing domain protein [Dunaliella salina]|uniref:WD40-repeat-containing domain protein n=1 Tax=Dunaliella salina TaxID=3046 RepID=A0ABQ7H4H3_DUNSA|nr:WD40-repeat-containing domain protein [Dunaliella salina]|eukprot:KAF5841762.1 WD40-repeat-containing domain protein [Dunaliella salina]
MQHLSTTSERRGSGIATNVLLDVEENAFLADFGLCKQVKDLSKVYTSNVGGTYLFMAPEKLGPPSGDKLRVGFASDVWAFGITMLQLLCCDTMAPYGRGISLPNIIMMLMVDRQAPRVPAVPSAPELQHTLQACLSLDYKERPSAAQLVQAFEGILSRLQSPASSSDAAAQGSSITRALNTQSAAPATRPLHLLSSPTCSATLTGQRKDVRSVAFTPDGATLVSGSFDNTIKLWDVASGSCRATLEGHTKRVRSVAVSKDGCTLVSGSDDRTARLWDLGSCRLTATLSDHTGWVFSVAISPDNATVASGSEDKTVRLWDARSGSHKATLQGHSAFVYCVAFSVDGTRLASGGGPGDATVRLWDTSSTSCVATLKGHTSAVRDVVFSQDGAALLSASDDSTVWVWDLKGSGECVATLRGHGGIVWSVAVSPDGRRLASGSRDQNIKLWRIPE